MSNLGTGSSAGFSQVARTLLATSAALLACSQSADHGAGTPPLPGARDEAAPAENVTGSPLVPGPSSSAASASANALCDGSTNVRVAHFSAQGYAEEDPYWFGERYGPSFLAIATRWCPSTT